MGRTIEDIQIFGSLAFLVIGTSMIYTTIAFIAAFCALGLVTFYINNPTQTEVTITFATLIVSILGLAAGMAGKAEDWIGSVDWRQSFSSPKRLIEKLFLGRFASAPLPASKDFDATRPSSTDEQDE